MPPKKLVNKEKLLLLFLIILTIVVRTNFEHQVTFDSFTNHAMAESISIHGYAKWILHPASLFGYYPLSYPSGLMYLLSVISTISGISMDYTILFFSIFIGISSVLALFCVVYKMIDFTTAYLSSLIFSLSPYFLYYTSWNASGRIMIVFFSIIMLFCIIKFIEQENLKSRMKYGILIFLIVIYGFLFHRTAQLLSVYLLAFVVVLIYLYFPRVYSFAKETKIYGLFVARYKKSKYNMYMDLTVLILSVVILKILDLSIRTRLAINIERFFSKFAPIYNFAWKLLFVYSKIYLIIFLLLALIAGIVCYLKRSWVKTKAIVLKDKLIASFKANPEKFLFVLLLIWTTYYFIRQFFGKSFYSPSLEEYTKSLLLNGDAPYIIFSNFLINYSTTVSILVIFIFVGFTYLILKNNKKPYDVLLLIAAFGFSGILLDKKYVRLFVIPLISILISVGLVFIFSWAFNYYKGTIKRAGLTTLAAFLALLLIIGAFVPLIRQQIINESDDFVDILNFKAAGKYIKSLNCQCSTVTTEELVAGVVIFSESGVPGASHNIYYFINSSQLNVQKISYEDVKRGFLAGEKLTDLWILNDWILGGQYYVGRHAKLVFENRFNDPRVQRVMNDYHEKYYIHDKNLKTNTYYDSIYDVKNKVYDNPVVSINDMVKGRA